MLSYYLGVCSTSHPPQKPWPLAAAAPHTTPKTLPDPSDMPTVASDVAVPRDLAVFTATTIEMEVQVGASPQLCTRRRPPPPVWVVPELPPPQMHRIGSTLFGTVVAGEARWLHATTKERLICSWKIFYNYCWSGSGGRNQQITQQPTSEPIGDIIGRFVVALLVAGAQQKHNNQSKEKGVCKS